jgi:hypothetical protein
MDVKRQKHYEQFSVQPVDFIVSALGEEWLVGNVIKYVLRYPEKNGLEDLYKAKHYIEMLINVTSGRKPREYLDEEIEEGQPSGTYYVYKHFDPITKEVVYVGRGSKGRAWNVHRNINSQSEHIEWMEELISKGYTPQDWVEIVQSGLSFEEAVKLEYDLSSYGLIFNKMKEGEEHHAAKLKSEEVLEIFNRAHLGKESLKDIAKDYGIKFQTVWSIKNKRIHKKLLEGRAPRDYGTEDGLQ